MTLIAAHLLPCLFSNNETAKLEAAAQKEQKKFVELGFPEALCKSHPDCVHFLISSGFAFSIAMYQAGPNEHGIRLDAVGHPLIKMQGEWQRWDHIRTLIEFDSKTARVISKGNPALGWNYISPDGIVQKDIYTYDEIYPIEQLSQEQHQSLRKQAETFWNTHKEVDPGQKKECVVQIVTSQRAPLPRNWFTENYLDSLGEHTFIRVVDEKGKVYSVGLVMPKDQLSIFNTTTGSTLMTVNSNAGTCDYDETRSFDSRTVTSVPMTTERKEAILRFISEQNREGIRFNLGKQSCLKFATTIMDMAGIEIETRIPLGEYFRAHLPSISKLPVCSQVARACKKIQKSVQPAFNAIEQSIPKPIKNALSFVRELISFVPRKIATVAANTLAYLLGGAKMTAPLPPGKEHQSKMDDKKLTSFHRLIHTFEDLFDDEKSDTYQSLKLKEWQKRQDSSIFYKYKGPKLYIVPLTIASKR